MNLKDVSDYKALLPIRKHALDDELEVQAEMLFHINEGKVKALAAMHQAKDELETAEAREYLNARRSGEKMTVQEMAGVVQRSEGRKQAWERFQEARREADRWEGLLEAWKQRGFALTSLSNLFLGSYYTVDGAGARRGSNAEYQEVRRVVAAARTGNGSQRRRID